MKHIGNLCIAIGIVLVGCGIATEWDHLGPDKEMDSRIDTLEARVSNLETSMNEFMESTHKLAKESGTVDQYAGLIIKKHNELFRDIYDRLEELENDK